MYYPTIVNNPVQIRFISVVGSLNKRRIIIPINEIKLIKEEFENVLIFLKEAGNCPFNVVETCDSIESILNQFE